MVMLLIAYDNKTFARTPIDIQVIKAFQPSTNAVAVMVVNYTQ